MTLADKSDWHKNIKNSYKGFYYTLSMSDLYAIQRV